MYDRLQKWYNILILTQYPLQTALQISARMNVIVILAYTNTLRNKYDENSPYDDVNEDAKQEEYYVYDK